MADNDKSKIRYDDFIGNVQPDPAKPESTIMLSGFVGHGPEGHARIYPDPTLGTWYDVPEDDVVYSTPIADSKLGGSYIWVRASSEIKPGSAAPAATEAAQPQQAAAAVNPTPRTHCRVCDPPQAAAALQPTPTVQTHCFICPPRTLAVHCWTAPVVCDTMQLPTPATHCFICPPPPQHSVPPTLCTVPQTLPCSLLCQADPRAAAQVLPNTAATLCTQFGCHPNAMPPTLWCTWVGCAPQGGVGGAPAGGAAAPQAAAHPVPGGLLQTHFLCTQGFPTFCGCTPGIDCNAPAPQPHQTHFLCTQGLATFCGCTPGIDCMGLAARAAPQQANTGVTVCVTDCQPPGNQMMRAAVGNPMDPTPQSRCFVCDPQNMLAMQPTPTVQTHCFVCPPHTLGTLRTSWFECHTHMAGCTVHICFQANQPQPQLGPPNPHTVGGGAISQCFCAPTYFNCPTHQIHCPTQPVVCNLLPTQPVVCGVLPPSFGCTQGCQQGGAPQVQAAAFEGATVICSQPARCTQACMPQPQLGPPYPHTVGGGAISQCFCAPPNTVNTPCATFVCPTLGACPTVAACTPNGVFTPFGR
jgi:hypothetical protein